MKTTTLARTAPLAAAATLLVAVAFVSFHQPLPARADAGTGTITGQVVWNAPLPVPYAGAAPGVTGPSTPDVTAPDQSEPTPDTAPDAGQGSMPAPGIPIRPVPRPRLIPAGAVLVAVQGTNLSARTDDQGRFSIDGVPTGQYLTVAAGPVRGVSTAAAIRPNVYVQNGGDTVRLGILYLGQSYGYPYPVPYATAPGAAVAGSGTGEAQPGQIAPNAP